MSLVKQDLPKIGTFFFFFQSCGRGLESRTTVPISKQFCMGILAFQSWDCDELACWWRLQIYWAKDQGLLPGVAGDEKQLQHALKDTGSPSRPPMSSLTYPHSWDHMAAFCRLCSFHSLPPSHPSQGRASSTRNWILGLSVRNGGVPEKMLTAVTQPPLCHQAAAIINERRKRSTQGAKKVDNDLCLPKGKMI